jgi:formylglycine-generating enzyme required for sulfatase activity
LQEDIGKVELARFEIGRYPVANRWFSRFVKEDGYQNRTLWTPQGQLWLETTQATRPRSLKDPIIRLPFFRG